MEEKKKKKKKKWWIPLIIVFVLFILPPVLVFALFYVPGGEKVNYREDETVQTFANRAIVDCLDKTETNHDLQVNLSEEDINTLIHGLMSNLPSQANNFIDQLYCKIDGTKYTFKLEAHAAFFKSTITLETKLVDDGNNVVFEIKKIDLGRVGVQGIARNILNNHVDNNTINDIFEKNGIHMTAEVEKLRLVYPKRFIVEDVSNMALKDSSESDSLVSALLNSVLSNDIEYSLTTNNSLGIDISLENFGTNEFYCTPDKLVDYSSKTNSARESLLSWIDNDYVAVNDIELAFKYLVYGYEKLSIDDQSVVDTFALPSSWGNKEEYKGFELPESKNIDDMMVETINNKTLADLSGGELCLLTEDEINTFLRSQRLIGTTYLLHRATENGYKANYIMVDNFYCNLINNHAYFVIDINFNGFGTSLIFDMEVYSAENNKLIFKAADESVFYGNMSVSSTLVDYVFGLLSELTTSETMIIDEDNQAIVFDFTTLLASPTIKPEIKLVIAASSGLELSAQSGLEADASNKEQLNSTGFIKLRLA